MSVRREQRRDPTTGKVRHFLMIDVDLHLPTGERKRVRKVSPVQTVRAAEQYERDIRSQMLNPLAAARWTNRDAKSEDAERPETFAQFCDRFLDLYVTTENKKSELAAKKMLLKNHLIPAFGNLPLREIGAELIQKYKSERQKEKYANKTIDNHLGVLRKALVMAVEWGDLDALPKVRWRMKKEECSFRYLSFAEAERLVEASDPTWQPMVLFALQTGLRIGELVALRWQDVDQKGGRIVVRHAFAGKDLVSPKNNRSREVQLSQRALEALRSQPRSLRGNFVFCRPNGDPRTRFEARKPLLRAIEKAGLKMFGWHTLRHTFASHLAMRGVSLTIVKDLLGHSDYKMTLRYSHLSPEACRDAVRMLDLPIPNEEEHGYGNMTATAK